MQRRSWLAWMAGTAGTLASLTPWRSWAQSGHETRRWPDGKPAPELVLPDLAGKTRTLAEFRGKVVVLNFWATWCPPCRAEMPSLQQLADFYDRDGLQVLAVDVGETAQQVGRFLASAGLNLLTLVDAQKETSRAWGVRVLPTTIILDRQGRPQYLLRGEVDWLAPEIAGLLDPLMRRPAGSGQA